MAKAIVSVNTLRPNPLASSPSPISFSAAHNPDRAGTQRGNQGSWAQNRRRPHSQVPLGTLLTHSSASFLKSVSNFFPFFPRRPGFLLVSLLKALCCLSQVPSSPHILVFPQDSGTVSLSLLGTQLNYISQSSLQSDVATGLSSSQ